MIITSNLPLNNFWFAIDPGEKGAVAFLHRTSKGDLWGWSPIKGCEGVSASSFGPRGGKSKAFVEEERVSLGMSPKAATTFMTGYGFILGYITAKGIPYTLMSPQKWMRGLGLKPSSVTNTRSQRKKWYGAQIRELYKGTDIGEVPAYAIDAFGILAAGLKLEREEVEKKDRPLVFVV